MQTVLASPALTPCQDRASDMLARQGNVFLTGAAGTGKSFLLERYLAGKPAEEFPIVASTGAAAVIVGGRTFHSFFGLGILEGGLESTIARALRSKKLLSRLQRAHCVVIDEVSMLPGAVLRAADLICRRARNEDSPWGGLRIIAVGDFAQLPPVATGGQPTDWAFRHLAWALSDFQPALLSTVMRTRDAEFLDVLNAVRAGDVTPQVAQFLDSRTGDLPEDGEATRLYAHRARAEEYNLQRLDAIDHPLRAFRTEYEGDRRAIEGAQRVIPIPETLLLKQGALVMMRKNDPSGHYVYVNGSLGHVTFIEEDTLYVRLLTGEDIELGKELFTSLDGDGKPVLVARNFPVTLAWATTIHKAQGATLDRVIVDLSRLWEPGQAYVALSRVRSAAGLYIERWDRSSIRAEPLVTEFYDGLADAAHRYVPRAFYAPPAAMTTKEKGEEKEKRAEENRERRAAMIRGMIDREATLQEMSNACEVKPERILLYLEKMLEDGLQMRISYLLEEVPDAERIRSALAEYGMGRLQPVVDALGGGATQAQVRTVRCVMLAEGGE